MGDSRIRIVSDGTAPGTKVQLVVRSGGNELHYDLPGIQELQWSVSAKGDKTAILHARIAGVHVDLATKIDTRTMSVEDLMTEIIAGRLARSPSSSSGENE